MHFNISLRMNKPLHYTKLSCYPPQKEKKIFNKQWLKAMLLEFRFPFFLFVCFFLMLVKSLYSNRQLLIWANDQISVQQLQIYPVTEIRIQSQATKKNKYSNDSSKNRVGKNVIYCNSYNWAISCCAITNHTPSWRHYALMAELLNRKKKKKKQTTIWIQNSRPLRREQIC